MRTVGVKVYKFAELSPKAKDRARIKLDDGWRWAPEALNSLKVMAEHFSGRLTDWNIDWTGSSRSSVEFSMPDDLKRGELRKRLSELGPFSKVTGKSKGNCKLTGWCWDDDCVDGFKLAFDKGESNLDTLMQAAFRSLLKSGVAEYEADQEDAQVESYCAANDIEFWDDGSIFRG